MAPLKPEEDKGLWKPLLLFPELCWGFRDEKATVSSLPSCSHGCLGQAVIQSEGMKRNVSEEVTVIV